MADKERYYIPIEGKLIEVEENVYVAYYRMGRRERYLVEQDQSNGVTSYDALDTENRIGIEALKEAATQSMEDIALAKELHKQLHRVIDALPRAERELIRALYFDQMTEESYGRKVKLSQSGVSRRHKKTLSKMKMLLDFMGSFC